jgi:hypothetical protein
MTTLAIYNPAFVAAVAVVLAKKTENGPVTRGVLCAEMGLSADKGYIFTELLSELPEYETVVGKNGGIGRKGAAKPQTSRLPSDFVTLLRGTLGTMLPAGSQKIVTRGQIAREMGIPCGDTEMKISLALKEKLVPGFISERGSGISRDPNYKEPAPQGVELTSDEADAASTEAAQTEAPVEAAPVAEVAADVKPDVTPDQPAARKGKKSGSSKK